MKNFNTLISFSFTVLLFTSCAIRGGYHNGSESFSYSSNGSSGVNVNAEAQKSSNAKSSASNSLNVSNSTSKSGFFIGIYFTDIELMDKLEIQPEIDFVMIKDFNQIQVPILAKYEVADKINALAGPNIGYLLDAGDGFKSLNFGIDIGAAYDVAEKININARYGFGLTNLLENAGNSSVKLSGFQIGVGYKF
ncbi:outer membrane beta-barrel protein [Algibacter sp. 2305UL17-15]|uniref:outer membrane beta-barrel protein n=1 Tax=Algibacter sp. 2305UL17-15 TaxID=3231268 RepID=UPI0034597DE7